MCYYLTFYYLLKIYSTRFITNKMYGSFMPIQQIRMQIRRKGELIKQTFGFVYCILHIAYCILHIAYCILHILHIAYIAYCILHILHIAYIAYCILHIAYCILHIAYCILHIAYCILHIAWLMSLSSNSSGGRGLHTPSPHRDD